MQGIEARATSAGERIGMGTARTAGNGAAGLNVDVPIGAAADVERLHALVEQLLVRNQQLEQALDSRVVIEQAKGVLAERLELDPERAFELLRRAARNNRVKIHDLAARVVGERDTPGEVTAVLR